MRCPADLTIYLGETVHRFELGFEEHDNIYDKKDSRTEPMPFVRKETTYKI
jgi:hypothetical protein